MNLNWFQYIVNSDELALWCEQNAKQYIVGIDTEFERRNTYFPELCLIQVSTRSSIACIDPLSCSSLEPLQIFLTDPERVKVIHAARQDVEVLEQAGILIEENLFDTQIASLLCGEESPIGYGELVSTRLEVSIDKSEQFTNWKQRPLTEQQLIYAADDVKYLLPLHEILSKKLKKLSRNAWLVEECNQLCKDGKSLPLTHAWKRLKNLTNMSRTEIERACALAVWREELAQKINIPRNWIVKDQEIKKLAVNSPSDEEAVINLMSKNKRFNSKWIKSILQVLRDGISIDLGQLDEHRALSKDDRVKVRDLLETSQEIANNNNLSQSFFISQREAKQIVTSSNPEKKVSAWRLRLLGDYFQKT